MPVKQRVCWSPDGTGVEPGMVFLRWPVGFPECRHLLGPSPGVDFATALCPKPDLPTRLRLLQFAGPLRRCRCPERIPELKNITRMNILKIVYLDLFSNLF